MSVLPVTLEKHWQSQWHPAFGIAGSKNAPTGAGENSPAIPSLGDVIQRKQEVPEGRMNLITSAVPTGLYYLSLDALHPSNELLGYFRLPRQGLF